MRYVLMTLGYGWALIGAANCVGGFSGAGEGTSTTVLGVGLMFNVLLFIFPGLVVGALGQRMGRPRKPAE